MAQKGECVPVQPLQMTMKVMTEKKKNAAMTEMTAPTTMMMTMLALATGLNVDESRMVVALELAALLALQLRDDRCTIRSDMLQHRPQYVKNTDFGGGVTEISM